MEQTFEGSVTKIVLRTYFSIGVSDTLKIKFKRPDNTVGEWTAVREDSERISYTTSITDLNKVGTWELQAYVEPVSPAYKLYGEIARLQVLAHIVDTSV